MKDTTKEEAKKVAKPPPKILESLFDNSESTQVEETAIKQDQVFQPLFDPVVEAPKAPERTAESEESIRKSQAASEFVTVKQVPNKPAQAETQA